MIFSWRYGTSPLSRLRNQLGLLLAYSTGWPVTLELLRFRLKKRLPPPAFYHMNEMPPSLVQVAQQPQFLDFPRLHLPDHFHYTGPWRQEASDRDPHFPWSRLDGRPLIYASMGTLQNRLPGVFQIVAEACCGLKAQLVIALGRKGASIPESLAGNPLVIDYGPQQALLQRASLVITHGGLNTTLESLREGLPMVVVPVTNDQPGIAARIRYLGMGEFIPVQRLTTARLRLEVKRVLTDSSYRETAATFARQLQALDGKVMAAGLIEAAFTSRQRITPDWLRAASSQAKPGSI